MTMPTTGLAERRPGTNLLTPRAAAKLLNVSPRWLRERTRRGDIPAVRYGAKLVRYRLEDIEAWIARHLKYGRPETQAGTASGLVADADRSGAGAAELGRLDRAANPKPAPGQVFRLLLIAA